MSDSRYLSGREFTTIALLAFVWLIATAWIRPLSFPDEGRYVGVAWEMLRSNEWLTPSLNGLPFFHKPPLFYWITAASMHLFGLNEWASRAASILGAWMGAMALYLFVMRWSGRRMARLTLLVLCVQPLFYIGGQFANLDMLVAGLITVTILLLAHAALCIDRGLPFRSTLASAYGLAALGVLAKGLIGAVLPGMVISVWLLGMRRWRTLIALIWWPAVIAFLAIVLPWFIVMQSRFPGFLDYFFVVQHFKRFAAGGFNNVQPFWFYPAILFVACLPWLPWLGRALSTRLRSDFERRSVCVLMLVWLGIVVIFFSIPQSKLIGYVFPALPPLAFLIAGGFQSTEPSQRTKRLWWAGTGAGVILCLGAVILFTAQPLHSSRELGQALGAQRGPKEPVIMLGHFYYDVPFYARLDQPVGVVDEWLDPKIRQHDNWRKELADAAEFAPEQLKQILLVPETLFSMVCSSKISWVIGASSANITYPFLKSSTPVFSKDGVTLWMVESSAMPIPTLLHCARRPSTGSGEMSSSPQ